MASNGVRGRTMNPARRSAVLRFSHSWQLALAGPLVLYAGACQPSTEDLTPVGPEPVVLPGVLRDACSVEKFLDRTTVVPPDASLIPDSLLDSDLERVADSPPVYPRDLRDARVQGWVIVASAVGPGGSVLDARTMASSDPRFEESALAAATGSRYTRPTRDGRPVLAFRCVPIRYRITRGGPKP